MFTASKMLPQLRRATIHNAVFASKGTQRLITRMPLTQSICGEVDQHELGTMIRLDPMQQCRGEKQCLPKCLLLGHEACSTGDVVSKCHCKNQLRNPEHKLEQGGDSTWRDRRYLCLQAPSNRSSINFIPAIQEGWANRLMWHLLYMSKG